MKETEFYSKLINLEDSLLRFAQHLTADRNDARDLVQETFLKVLKNKEKFAYESSFKSWTYTILKNTFINNFRRTTKLNLYRSHPGTELGMGYIPASGDNNPDTIYRSKELERIIKTLHADFRLPFTMHLEGFMYQEIADKLDLSMGTIKSRIFFARKKLMKQLA